MEFSSSKYDFLAFIFRQGTLPERVTLTNRQMIFLFHVHAICLVFSRECDVGHVQNGGQQGEDQRHLLKIRNSHEVHMMTYKLTFCPIFHSS